MRVKELIEELNKIDPELLVLVQDFEYGPCELSVLTIDTVTSYSSDKGYCSLPTGKKVVLL